MCALACAVACGAEPARAPMDWKSVQPEAIAAWKAANNAPDGMVVELGGEGRSWPDVDAFHEARGRMEARLLEHHAGSGGYFGTGVVLTSGAVAELGGKMRSWPCADAFLHDAGDMDADLVRWCPPG